MEHDLQVMMSRLMQFGKLFDTHARLAIESVYQNGVANRREGEALFRVNNRLGLYADPSQARRFITAISDYLLITEAPKGIINDDEADWVIARLGGDGGSQTAFGIDLLLHISKQAQTVPQRLMHYTFKAANDHIIAKGLASAASVQRVQSALSVAQGQVGTYEASLLLATNDKIAAAPNHESWNTFFARTIGNYLTVCWSGDEAEQQTLSGAQSAEYALFNQRFSTNQAVTPAEQALITLLDSEAPDLVKYLKTAR